MAGRVPAVVDGDPFVDDLFDEVIHGSAGADDAWAGVDLSGVDLSGVEASALPPSAPR